jgi:protein TonB
MSHARIDPLELREPLTRPFVWSLSLHLALAGTTVAAAFFQHTPFTFGDPRGDAGRAVAVNVVQGVPLPPSPSRVENPVANPVEHSVPSIAEPPRPIPRPEPAEDDPAAVPVEKSRQRRRKPASNQQRNQPAPSKNQLSSSTGARVSSPLYTGRQSSAATGGVGIGRGNPFGSGYAWYADALQRRLADEWRRTLGQASGGSRNLVLVTFTIQANGAFRDIRIAQTSGTRTLDYSAHRAVLNASPFRPLPRGLGRRSVLVEIYFRMR